jgi:hypothetical protein
MEHFHAHLHQVHFLLTLFFLLKFLKSMTKEIGNQLTKMMMHCDHLKLLKFDFLQLYGIIYHTLRK